MHRSSVYALEYVHAEQLTAATKFLTEQITRELGIRPKRGKTLFLRTPYYEVTINSSMVGIDKNVVFENTTEVFGKVLKELKGFGFFKLHYFFLSKGKIRVRLFFSQDLVHK